MSDLSWLCVWLAALGTVSGANLISNFRNFDFEDMAVQNGVYTDDAWSSEHGTNPGSPNGLVNSFNLGDASETFLHLGDFDPGDPLSFPDLQVSTISGMASMALWGMNSRRFASEFPNADFRALSNDQLEFVVADIYQSGTVPIDAQSLIFAYADDRPLVLVDDVEQSVILLESNSLGIDMYSYEGQDIELRFRAAPGIFVLLDDIRFTDRTIPEPTTSALIMLTLSGFIFRRSWRIAWP